MLEVMLKGLSHYDLVGDTTTLLKPSRDRKTPSVL